MSPPKETPQVASLRRKTFKRFVTRKAYYIRDRFARASYFALIAGRYADGLLNRFACAGCGAWTLDPIGWKGPRQPLCEACSDP
jgi:hypothetical protein